MQSERGIFCAGFASGFYLIGFINNAPIGQTPLTHVHSPYGCKTAGKIYTNFPHTFAPLVCCQNVMVGTSDHVFE